LLTLNLFQLNLLPGVTGAKNLMPLYDKSYDKIRQYDENTIIFYEPVTWAVMSTSKIFGIGFNRPPSKINHLVLHLFNFIFWVHKYGRNI